MEHALYNPFRPPLNNAALKRSEDAPEGARALEQARLKANVAALAAASLGLDKALRPAAPILARAGLSCRPACLADVCSGWFAYWARELGAAVLPDKETWRGPIVLQALFEAGLLRRGARVGLDDDLKQRLGDYLRSLSVEIVGEFQEPLNAWASMKPPHTTMKFLSGARILICGDYAFAGSGGNDIADPATLERWASDLRSDGWTVGPLEFDLGAHPLDEFIASEALGEASHARIAPSMRVAKGLAFVTPYLLVGDRLG